MINSLVERYSKVCFIEWKEIRLQVHTINSTINLHSNLLTPTLLLLKPQYLFFYLFSKLCTFFPFSLFTISFFFNFDVSLSDFLSSTLDLPQTLDMIFSRNLFFSQKFGLLLLSLSLNSFLFLFLVWRKIIIPQTKIESLSQCWLAFSFEISERSYLLFRRWSSIGRQTVTAPNDNPVSKTALSCLVASREVIYTTLSACRVMLAARGGA